MQNDFRSEKKQIEILDAALNLFLKYSARKTSMDDIAKEACASKVTIYKYFSDKDTLCQRVFEFVTDQYMQSLTSSGNTDASLTDSMIQVTSHAAHFISSGRKALCEELASLNSSLRQAYEQLMQEQTRLIYQLIREGRQQNLIQAWPDDDVIFHYINMGLCYYQYNTEYHHKIDYDAGFRQRFMTFIWRNVFVDPTLFKA